MINIYQSFVTLGLSENRTENRPVLIFAFSPESYENAVWQVFWLAQLFTAFPWF